MSINYSMAMTDQDAANLSLALQNPENGQGAKIAALKMISTIAQNQATFGFDLCDIFDALSEGLDGVGESELCCALAWETRILGSWGGLVIQAAGLIQLFTWLKELTSWFIGIITSIESFFVGMMGKVVGTAVSGIGGAISSPLSSFLNLLSGSASGTQPAKTQDGRYIRRDASAVMQGLMIMASSEAPAMTAVINMLGTNSGSTTGAGNAANAGTGTGTGTGSGTGSGTGAGTGTGGGTGSPQASNTGTGGNSQSPTGLAASTPQNQSTGSAGGTGTGTGGEMSDNRRRRDGRALGQNTRRSLVGRASRG